MKIIEAIAEMKRLADYLSEESTALAIRLQDNTPHDDVVNQLNGWINYGYIVTRTSQGDRTQVANAIKNGYLYPTSFASVVATDKGVRDMFEAYVDKGRIMDLSRLSVRKGFHTQHSIEKAVRNGEIESVDSFCPIITLYVD